MRRASFAQVVAHIWTDDYRIIEIPEPLAITVLPRTVLIALLLKLKRQIRRAPGTTVVFYAIENLDQVEKVRSRFRVPRPLIRWGLNMAIALVFSEASRVVFGTAGSLRTYESQLGARLWRHLLDKTEMRLIPGLSAPVGLVPEKDADLACFLGSFERRKGISELMSAWPMVAQCRPGSRLVVIGYGPLAADVEKFALAREDVSVWMGAGRAKIREILNSSHCLVLPSQRSPIWREQIGLPILEALSAGCEVVTTSETGIAQWLNAHGHRVVDAAGPVAELAAGISMALNDTRSPAAVREALPEVDGRIEADRWLFGQ
ncbi:glycosyltransferase family 4 protein [Humibacter ginsengiterrae]